MLTPAYRLAAFWSGQEGSLLLWALMISGFAAAAGMIRKRVAAAGEGVTLSVLAALDLFFGMLLLFAANPFALETEVGIDGMGLNPQLQHWAMIAHPPMLFMGYAGFAVPFAIMCGALAAGRRDNLWVSQMRRWSLAAWSFLSVGIVLGAWWAYVELGWGGYWAWDPVENASLLPWLTGTALLHAIIVHEHRGMLKEWTAGLAAASFILCVFGTYITRSGVVQSVHAFGQSGIGTFFLVFLLILITGSAALIVRRRRVLISESVPEGILGREGLSFVGISLLCCMAAITVIGTVFPLISEAALHAPVSVGQAFYNRTVAPLGLAVGALLAIAPLLVYGRSAAGVLGRSLRIPGAVAAVSIVAAYARGMHNPAAPACLAICVVAALSTTIAFVRAVRAHPAAPDRGIVRTIARVIDSNHRRYGGQLAHLGVVVIFVGIAGSSLFSEAATRTLHLGESMTIGDRTLRLESMREVHGANFVAAEAALAHGGRPCDPGTAAAAAVLRQDAGVGGGSLDLGQLREDVYVALAGWEDGGTKAAIQARINPMTVWIWIGAALMVSGAALCMLPRLLPRGHGARFRGKVGTSKPPVAHARRGGAPHAGSLG